MMEIIKENKKLINTWALMILSLVIGIVFLYQEPIVYGQKLAIGDVKTQGLIFEKYKDDYYEKYDDHPLWYPYIFCGMPFHASGTYRLQYTLETLYKVVPSFIRKRFSAGFTFNLLIGAIFMILLMRSYGLGYASSIVGAMAFIFTTKILGTPHTNRIVTFIHLPIILYALRQLWNTKKWVFMILLGGAVGSQIGSYHPQVAFYGLLMIGLYTVYRFIYAVREKTSWKDLLQISIMIGFSLGLGYLMASIVLTPMQEYLPFSIRGASGGGDGVSGLSYDYATGWSFSWWEIFSMIIPSFSGFGGNTYWGDMPFTSYPHYLGIPVIILAIFALINTKKRKDYWFFILMMVFSLLIGMGKNFSILSHFLLNYLPYFNKFREPSMILILFAMSTAVFTGWGFQILVKQISDSKTKDWSKIVLKFIIGIGVFGILILLFNNGLKSFMYSIYNNADIATGRVNQFPDERQMSYLYQMRFDMFYNDLLITVLLSLCTLGLIWGGLTKRISKKPFIIVMMVLLFVDLAYIGRQVVPPMFSNVPKKSMEPRKTKTIDYLLKDKDLFRILPLDNFTTNQYAWFGIPSIGGYHAAKMASYQDFLDRNFTGQLSFLRMTNTKYVISKQRFNHPELLLKHSANGENIYQVKDYLPRVFLVDSVTVLNSDEDIFELLKSNTFDPQSHAIIDQPMIPSKFESVDSEVKITHWEPQQLLVSANMNETGLLIFSEGYYSPGWKAFVDGNQTDIIQTNHFMQSIIVPKGEHKVEFRFELDSFTRALWLSKVIFFGVILLLIGNGIFMYRSMIVKK